MVPGTRYVRVMKNILLRGSSLTFAIVVTGFFMARAAGCTAANDGLVPVSPTSTPPATAPTTPSNPGNPGAPPFSAPSAPSAPPDAGPTLGIASPHLPLFMSATKSGRPLFEPPAPQQAPSPSTP